MSDSVEKAFVVAAMLLAGAVGWAIRGVSDPRGDNLTWHATGYRASEFGGIVQPTTIYVTHGQGGDQVEGGELMRLVERLNSKQKRE